MMMAAAGPPSASGFVPLLETLEDGAATVPEQTDAYLTIANRLSGEDGRQFLPAVEKHFSRLAKVILGHISSPSADLSQAALQALGFCVYHSHVVSGPSESFTAGILSALCSLVVKSTDKNTCTRALWVISKQSFPADTVGKRVPSILGAVESVWSREDVQSVVMEHEALNVIIRMLEQVPAPMGAGAVRWAKLVIPLVVHSATKVRLRAAAALEMGMPLLLEKQTDVAAIIEPMMSTKLIPELQKLYVSKNETNVLKLWPLFVRLLGKLLHRGGPFINSLLHLEELGFRSSSATIKKIAFIAWKSLIDNFALNPDILSSGKRIKLIMQPLTSISVRTEALQLTKVEVWWYLVVQLGSNLWTNFEQVSVPLLQCTIGSDSSSVLNTPSRTATSNGAVTPGTPKTGFSTPSNSLRLGLSTSLQLPSTFSSIQLLGLEMVLHYLLGPEVGAVAARHKLVLSLEPLKQPLLSGSSSFTKHAAMLINAIREGFISVGTDAPDPLLTIIWSSLLRLVSLTIDSAGSKKERHGGETLTLTLGALQSIVASEALPAHKVLALLEVTVKGIPPRVLGSASYQVGKMDVLNGTPALFLLLLLFDSGVLAAYVQDERFFRCLQTLVGCGLSGPASPLAFAEAVLGAVSRGAPCLQSKEQLCRMWSAVVNPLTDTITQSNEVNQGDALEHNFSAVHAALMLPVTHLLHGTPLPQALQRSMLSSWSKLYRAFARCSALVVTAEENICCEELSAKMAAAIDQEALRVPAAGGAVACMLQVMVECVDFSPYTPQFQQKLKSPRTPVSRTRKKNQVLGNLSSFQSLLVQSLEVHLQAPGPCPASSDVTPLLAVVSALFTNLVVADAVWEALTSLIPPLTLFYKEAAGESLLAKLEKLLADVLGSVHARSTPPFHSELLALLSPLLCVLFPHRNKQIRNAVTTFWNATFANTVWLSYPEDLRSVLIQVKQTTPIILPGLDLVSVPNDLGGLDSNESSQLETKISGIPVSSAGTKDPRPDPKDKTSTKTPKPVSTKLDFGSPKPPRREVLEEETSVEFVFIPPEAKERVLTEHQKEVKRTRRVDIPTMYNTLDASLDTTTFTQFTQSQDDSLDTQPAGPSDGDTTQAPEQVDGAEDSPGLSPGTLDHVRPAQEEEPRGALQEGEQEEQAPPLAAVDKDVKSKDRETIDSPSLNMSSSSSDLVFGTPQRLSSRRQSFITLEKYQGRSGGSEGSGRSGSPTTVASFTGPLVKTSNTSETPPSLGTASETYAGPTSEDPESSRAKTDLQGAGDQLTESPRRPKDCRRRSEPVRLTERLAADTKEREEEQEREEQQEEDVIPDTQTQEEMARLKTSSVLEETASWSQEEEQEEEQEACQSSGTSSQECPCVRPPLPGEDGTERDSKFALLKRKRSGGAAGTDETRSRPRTRSQQEAGGRRRTRSQGAATGATQPKPQKRVKPWRDSEDLVHKLERRRRVSSDLESSQTDSESQSQGRRQRRSKTTIATETPPGGPDSCNPAARQPEEPMEEAWGTKDSEIVRQSPLAQGNSQTMKPAGDKREDPPSEGSSAPSQEPEPVGTVTGTNRSQTEPGSTALVPREDRTGEHAEENLSQEDSESLTAPASEGQSLRRSRRSKTTLEGPESEEQHKRQSRSNSQTPEAQSGGRTTRSRGQEDCLTPESSQSLDTSGSESSQARSSGRRSAPAGPGLESSEGKESTGSLKKKGRRPRASLQTPPDPSSPRTDPSEGGQGSKSQTDTHSTEPKTRPDMEELTQTRDFLGSESLQVSGHVQECREEPQEEEPGSEESQEEEPDEAERSATRSDQRDPETEEEGAESTEVQAEDPPCESMALPGESPEGGAQGPAEGSEVDRDKWSVVSAEDAAKDGGTEVVSKGVEEQEEVAEKGDQEEVGEEEGEQEEVEEEEGEQEEVEEDEVEQEEGEELHTTSPQVGAKGDAPPLQENQPDRDASTTALQDGEEPSEVGVSSSETQSGAAPTQHSPVKQKDPQGVTGADAGQSPSVGGLRGTWSPSASPSTSILKKGQKRALQADSPSPSHVKSRRVSFADPIQHQETADDIDRRSPALRTSSPREARGPGGGPLQPKLVTTPIKRLGVLSPRSLHSPGFKSSKKCLISQMSQEPRPVSRDCIFPALVGCSAPVEAVLPQISSNMWSRGFGQLVRARNIKTVGDLSALTPAEVKALPVRSPKVSNVKKALQAYQQQRRGRGGDELKSFDETEMMTSEVEETSAPQTEEEEEEEEEEDKPPGDSLAVAMEDEAALEQQDVPGTPSVDADRPLPELQALSRRMTAPQLRRCSPQELLHVHEQLGELMRRVVVELQARLQPVTD